MSTYNTILVVSVALILGCSSGWAQPTKSYKSDFRHWQEKRIADLRAPQGWLSLAGLLWLGEGDNSFGSAAGNKIVFPAAAPSKMGAFRLQNDKSVWMSALAEAGVQFQNKPVTELLLWPGSAMSNAGRFSWVVIKQHALSLGAQGAEVAQKIAGAAKSGAEAGERAARSGQQPVSGGDITQAVEMLRGALRGKTAA